jgi:hypothetical protein
LIDGSGSTATWLAGSPLGFTTQFDGASKNSLRLEASINAAMGTGWLGTLGYRGLLGSGNQTISVIEARVALKS